MRRALLSSAILAGFLTLGASAPANAQVSFGIQIGQPPPPPRAYRVAPMPGPDYEWIEGFWYRDGRRWAWRDGYWTRPPYAGAYWVSPYYSNGHWVEGYWDGGRGRHRWDRGDRRRDYRYEDRRDDRRNDPRR